jgi:hypothetical protein
MIYALDTARMHFHAEIIEESVSTTNRKESDQ